MPQKVNQTDAPVRSTLEEQVALRWAALLCGHEVVPDPGLQEAAHQVANWDSRLEGASLMPEGILQQLPEPFMTTGFQHEVKSIHAQAERLRHICGGLRQAQLLFAPALAQVAKAFGDDEDQLVRWKKTISGLPDFKRWLPAFETAFDYLSGAFTTPLARVEEIRQKLLSEAADPGHFLEQAGRDRFDRDFGEFKQGYAGYYHESHENTVHIFATQEKSDAKVDYMALRNLELLSELDRADRSYLNRVRSIGKWVQAHQCDLPVMEILAHHPRCYCGFNPEASGHLTASVEQMNEAIRQGIDHFRSALRCCRMPIIQELRSLRIDVQYTRQIATLLSREPMIQLKPQSISIINAIMRKRADAFRAATF